VSLVDHHRRLSYAEQSHWNFVFLMLNLAATNNFFSKEKIVIFCNVIAFRVLYFDLSLG
jgi:hypothetical protein